jgi:hypothetical protein
MKKNYIYTRDLTHVNGGPRRTRSAVDLQRWTSLCRCCGLTLMSSPLCSLTPETALEQLQSAKLLQEVRRHPARALRMNSSKSQQTSHSRSGQPLEFLGSIELLDVANVGAEEHLPTC